MRTPPYRHDLDWVAVDRGGRMVASVCVWLDASTASRWSSPSVASPSTAVAGSPVRSARRP